MAQPHTKSPPVAIDSARLDLGNRYDYIDQERVQSFLAEHPHLVGILREADQEIATRFGTGTVVTLEVVDDTELNDKPFVIGYIRAKLPSKEFIDRLHQMDVEWWLPRSTAAKSQLLFSFG